MENASTIPPATQRQFRVLVIDDNETDREITTHHLSVAWPFEHEMAVEYAATGREALEKIHDRRFTLIILDWKLPGLGGADLLRQIRQDGVRVPIIVLSGLAREAVRDDLEARAAAFLNKNEMDSVTFHRAIATSLQLLGLTQPAAATAE